MWPSPGLRGMIGIMVFWSVFGPTIFVETTIPRSLRLWSFGCQKGPGAGGEPSQHIENLIETCPEGPSTYVSYHSWA